MTEHEPNKYWYMTEHQECPVCGEYNEVRYRVYDTPKPEDYEDRHKFTYLIHYCDV